jgi:hypothetical protein
MLKPARSVSAVPSLFWVGAFHDSVTVPLEGLVLELLEPLAVLAVEVLVLEALEAAEELALPAVLLEPPVVVLELADDGATVFGVWEAAVVASLALVLEPLPPQAARVPIKAQARTRSSAIEIVFVFIFIVFNSPFV